MRTLEDLGALYREREADTDRPWEDDAAYVEAKTAITDALFEHFGSDAEQLLAETELPETAQRLALQLQARLNAEKLLNPHPKTAELLEGAASTLEAEGLTLDEVISPEDQARMHDISHAIDTLFEENPDATVDDVKALLAAEPLSFKLRSIAGQGSFGPLTKVGPLGTDAKSGGLIFVVLGKGDKAPTHPHVSPEGTNLPGELTITLRGSLSAKAYDGSGRIETQTREDGVRVSPDGSVDEYEEQEEMWVGWYIQFKFPPRK